MIDDYALDGHVPMVRPVVGSDRLFVILSSGGSPGYPQDTIRAIRFRA